MNVVLCVREAKQSTPKKHFPSSPLVSVIEKEETKCQESFEPNAAKGSTDSPSNPDKTQVHTLIFFSGGQLACVNLTFKSII